eukprot:CAMPEP_0177689298 /NCGR_PEP_ID=MMETSP0484_2-20121128/102_1 /TAXON_ID=354590 /ORGANISM="Rhodomonas lens, Strain RHODO" /LENGTH=122 /DNA_ID=CAMNT_0019199653 /DNA_START=585 /DNA_END=953 /DNA_ORIENTATION=+
MQHPVANRFSFPAILRHVEDSYLIWSLRCEFIQDLESPILAAVVYKGEPDFAVLQVSCEIQKLLLRQPRLFVVAGHNDMCNARDERRQHVYRTQRKKEHVHSTHLATSDPCSGSKENEGVPM